MRYVFFSKDVNYGRSVKWKGKVMEKVQKYRKIIAILEDIGYFGFSLACFIWIFGAAFKLIMIAYTIYPIDKATAVRFSEIIVIIILVVTIIIYLLCWDTRQKGMHLGKDIFCVIVVSVFSVLMVFCSIFCLDYSWGIPLYIGIVVLFLLVRSGIGFLKRLIEKSSVKEKEDTQV